MADAGRKWLIAGGIGCGLIIVILGGIGTCGYLGYRTVKEGAERIEASFAEMTARFGDAGDFTPPVDGRVPAVSMEAFLAARDRIAPERTSLARMMDTFDREKRGGVLKKITTGLRFIPALLDFIALRNQALLQEGMGLGEYQHIYVLAYFGLLGKDPGDGPSFAVIDEDDGREAGARIHIESPGDDDEAQTRQERRRRVRRFVNRVQSRVVANQLRALDSLDSGSAAMGGLEGVDRDAWRAALAAEVAALDAEPLRLPWEDGLPDQTRASLEPYRERLEASYDAATGVIEMGLMDEEVAN